jgi:catechol-2,3-dioxygenase
MQEGAMKLPTLGPDPTPPPAAFTSLAAIHLRTSDLDRSVRFYGGVLGLPLVRTEPQPKRRYFFAAGAQHLVLEEVAEPAGSSGAVAQIGLGVANVDALEEVRRRLLGNGVPVSGLEDHGYAYGFRFRDPTTGVILQAQAPARAWTEADRTLDPDPTPTAKELLSHA